VGTGGPFKHPSPQQRGLLRDVYFGWPIVHSYMSPNAGGGGGGVAESQPMSTAVHMEPK